MNLKNKPEVKNLIIYILLFWIIGITNVHLHAQNVAFSNLTTEDGLSQFSVNSLYIDENGMLWIGTREGLNRYNGTDIQTYKLDITGDKKGKIFLLCNDGVAQLDLRTQKFKTLLVDNIHSIYYNQGLYIAKRNEIYLYNEDTGNFDLCYQLAGNTPEIYCMHIDDRYLWIGTTTDGVYRLQLDSMALSQMAFIAYNWIAWLCLIRLKKVTLPVFMRIVMESCGLEVGKMDFIISVLMAVFVILSTTLIIRIVYRPIL